MIELRLGGEVLAGGVDHGVQVRRHARRAVRPRVAGPEAATQVVDRELAQRRDRGHRLGERLDLHDLRADVGVHAAHPQRRRRLDPGDQLAGPLGRDAELGAGVPGEHARVGVGLDARDHPHQHVLGGTGGQRGLQPVEVVGTVDDHQPEAVLDGHRDLLVALRVAVQHDLRGVDPGAQPGDDLATAGDVEPEALLHHHPLHGRAREGLGREDDTAARPAGGEPVGVLAGPRPQGVLGHDEHRGAGLGRDVVEPAPGDQRHPVGVRRAAGGEQVVDAGHPSADQGQ